MGKNYKYSIHERMSFEPEVVKQDITELERIAEMGRLSPAGYAELNLLQIVAEAQEKEKKNASTT